jgi:hypothetical protein
MKDVLIDQFADSDTTSLNHKIYPKLRLCQIKTFLHVLDVVLETHTKRVCVQVQRSRSEIGVKRPTEGIQV